MIKIIESPVSRSTFIEGRNYGLGVAFAKKEKDIYKGVQPLSACKDFLNDEIWSECTGKPFSVFGQKSIKRDIFTNKNYAFMFISFLPNKGHPDEPKFIKERDSFNSKIKNVEKILRELDSKAGIKYKTTISKTNNDNIFLVKVPRQWVTTSYAISLYTLIARNGENYSKKQNLSTYLKDVDKIYTPDKMLLSPKVISSIDKLKELPELFNSEVEDFVNGSPHNKGIVHFTDKFKL